MATINDSVMFILLCNAIIIIKVSALRNCCFVFVTQMLSLAYWVGFVGMQMCLQCERYKAMLRQLWILGSPYTLRRKRNNCRSEILSNKTVVTIVTVRLLDPLITLRMRVCTGKGIDEAYLDTAKLSSQCISAFLCSALRSSALRSSVLDIPIVLKARRLSEETGTVLFESLQMPSLAK